MMLNLQNQEAEALTGVKSFGGGISGEAYGDVAAGIRGVLDAASKREMAILRRLAKGMEEIGTKIAAMNAAFLSEEETVRITNDEFVTVKREDLKETLTSRWIFPLLRLMMLRPRTCLSCYRPWGQKEILLFP